MYMYAITTRSMEQNISRFQIQKGKSLLQICLSLIHISKVRKLAFEDLDKCTKTILKNTIEYLTECGQEIDERTVETYKYYRDKKEN